MKLGGSIGWVGAIVLLATCGNEHATRPPDAAAPERVGGAGGGGGGGGGGNGGLANTGGDQPDPRDASPAGADGASPVMGSDGGLGGASIDAGAGNDAGAVTTPGVCPAGPFPLPVPGASQILCAGFAFNYSFNEGPTWVARENAFFFSNYIVRSPTMGDIIKYTPGGECEVFLSDVGCNGLAATADGNLLAACHQSRSLIRIDVATKKTSTLVDSYMGQLLDSPNDVVIHNNGTVYFTNTTFELGNRPPGVGLAVFRLDPLGALQMVAPTPCNGIALSPDQKRLYVLQGGAWDVDPNGVPSNRTPLFTGGDGMAVDCGGNLYASATIFSPDGQRLGSYGAGTNLAFGGPDGKTLFIVGGGPRNGAGDNQVRAVTMNIPGLP